MNEEKKEPTEAELRQYEEASRAHKVFTADAIAKALESSAADAVFTTVVEQRTYVSPAVFRALAAYVKVGPAPKRPGIDQGQMQLIQLLVAVLGPLIQKLIEAISRRQAPKPPEPSAVEEATSKGDPVPV